MEEKTIEKDLEREIENASGDIILMAGHFALVFDDKKGKLVPGVFQDIDDKKKKKSVKENPYMGYFPLETWKMGIRLAAFAKEKGKNVKVAILANDWQWIPKAEFGEKNTLRDDFYKNSEFPKSFKKELEKNGLDESVMLPFKTQDGKINNKLFFSEQRLRKRFVNYLAAKCDLNNQCAQEYVPFLNQLEKEKVNLLVSFIPKTCMSSIKEGTRRSKEDFGVKIKVVNVFTEGIFEKSFWEDAEISKNE